ncbi:TPA: hypothetical protein CPT96_08445 [Candidatus Gastranaerophilales bacterium HUM_10]|nr:MAG TPA: hypothetical protein CPT96_08445 [Candidatus Gastranaerophilales bacterium HUM_10]
MLRMRKRLTDSSTDVLVQGDLSQTILSHSNSFSIEMEKDTAGYRAFNLNYYCRRLILMKKEKKLSNKMRNGIKKGLSVALITNANSSGCFIIYQPKTPKALEKFKNIK